MDVLLNTAQVVLAGDDTSIQRQWHETEKKWREEDMQWRIKEEELMLLETKYMDEERQFMIAQIQQQHLENARYLWNRFVKKNDLSSKGRLEQLRTLAGLSALMAGFSMVSFLELNLINDLDASSPLVPLYTLTIALTTGVEMGSVVMCSLMLATLQRIAKQHVSEEEEAEFMYHCKLFLEKYKVGDRPPEPSRSFEKHWSIHCESEWRLAFRLFAWGVPIFFLNLIFAGWMKFGMDVPSCIIITVVLAIATCANIMIHRKWSEILLREEHAAAPIDQIDLPALGLPFDWHLPPRPGVEELGFAHGGLNSRGRFDSYSSVNSEVIDSAKNGSDIRNNTNNCNHRHNHRTNHDIPHCESISRSSNEILTSSSSMSYESMNAHRYAESHNTLTKGSIRHIRDDAPKSRSKITGKGVKLGKDNLEERKYSGKNVRELDKGKNEMRDYDNHNDAEPKDSKQNSSRLYRQAIDQASCSSHSSHKSNLSEHDENTSSPLKLKGSEFKTSLPYELSDFGYGPSLGGRMKGSMGEKGEEEGIYEENGVMEVESRNGCINKATPEAPEVIQGTRSVASDLKASQNCHIIRDASSPSLYDIMNPNNTKPLTRPTT